MGAQKRYGSQQGQGFFDPHPIGSFTWLSYIGYLPYHV